MLFQVIGLKDHLHNKMTLILIILLCYNVLAQSQKNFSLQSFSAKVYATPVEIS